MALKFGSTTISSSYTPKFNSTALKSIKYGSTEVWTSEVQIFPDTSAIIKTGNGYSGAGVGLSTTNTSSKVGGQASNANGGVVVFYIPISLSSYKTIKITGSYSAGTYVQLSFGIYSALPTVADYGGSDGTLAKTIVGPHAASVSGNSTWTFDVSGLSGRHYIGARCYSGSTVDAVVNAYITKIVAQ